MVVLSAGVLSGCSSSLFTGDKASELDHLNGDGRFNKLCMGLDMSKSTLDVPTARALVKCLNSNGSIPAYEALVNKMTDAQLGVVLDVVNAEVMTNPTRLRQIDQSFTQMDQRGIINRAFGKLSTILAHPKLARAAIKLARQGTHTDNNGKIDKSVLTSIKVLADVITDSKSGPEGLAAARANLDRALSTGSAVTALSSYKAMVNGLRSTIHPLPNVTLEGITRLLHEYIVAKINSPDRAYGKILMWGIADKTLFDALDYYYDNECEGSAASCQDTLGRDAQIAAMEDFMKMLTLDQSSSQLNREKYLKPMMELFNAFDAKIDCMGNTKDIPNADMFVMNELAGLTPLNVPQWVMRDNSLKMKLADSLCDFKAVAQNAGSASFNDMLTVLREMARYESHGPNGGQTAFGRPLITVAHFLRGLEQGEAKNISDEDEIKDLGHYFKGYTYRERYRRFLVHWLGDPIGDGVTQPSTYRNMTDALAELVRPERRVMGNLLYFLNVPGKTVGGVKPAIARDDIVRVTQILMKLRPELHKAGDDVPGVNPAVERSLYDVASYALKKVDPSTVVDVALGMSELIDLDEDLASPLLEVSRDALLVNDVDPVMEIALDLARDAENRNDLFQTLFDIADTKEFEDALTLTSTMAANGTLKELLQGVLTIFKGTSDKGNGNANPGDVPPVQLVDASRDRCTSTAPAWQPVPAPWPADATKVEGCYALNFDQPFSDSFSQTWHDQMTELGKCAAATPGNDPVQRLVDFGNDMNGGVRAGRSLWGTLVHMIASLIPEKTDSDYTAIWAKLSDLMMDGEDFEDMKRMNSLLPLATTRTFCTKYDEVEGRITQPAECSDPKNQITLTQALGRMSHTLQSKADSGDLRNLLAIGSGAVTNKKALQGGLYLYDSFFAADESMNGIKADEKPHFDAYPINDYHGGTNKNLRNELAAAIRNFEKHEPTEQDLNNKVYKYLHEPFGGKETYYKDYNGNWRSGLANADELKKMLKPLLDELSLDWRIESSLAFFSYFGDSGQPEYSHYDADWWADWFQRLAANVRPIPYYYPGSYPSKNNPPTVRLVSQLDLLDLIVIDADFSLREVGMADGPLGLPGSLFMDPDSNRSIFYLTCLAEHGRNMQPCIDAMGHELNSFISMMGDPLLGATMKPEVKRHLFNLKYIFHIMQDANVEHAWPRDCDPQTNWHKGCRMLNDLGVLRDLFKATLRATPQADRHNYRRDKNSLSVVTKLVAGGVLHNAGVNMWLRQGNNEPVANNVAPILRFLIESSLVKGSDGKPYMNKGTFNILNYLLRQDCDRSLARYKNGCNTVPRDQWAGEPFNERYRFIGKLLDQIFDWIKDDDYKGDHGEVQVMTLIKRAGYDLLQLVDGLNARDDGPRDTYTPSIMPIALQSVLANEHGTSQIAANFDVLGTVLKDPFTIHLLEKLAEGIDEHNARHDDFNAVRATTPDIIEQLAENDGAATASAVNLAVLLKDDAGYQATKSVLKYARRDDEYAKRNQSFYNRVSLKLRNWALRGEEPVQKRLRAYLADELAHRDPVTGKVVSSEVQDLLNYIGRQSSQPDEKFANTLKFIGENRDSSQPNDADEYPWVKKLNDFIDLMHKGLVRP